jgi:hypothetical protein
LSVVFVASAASASPLGIGPRKICGAERFGRDVDRPPRLGQPLDLRNLAFFCVERNSVVLRKLRPLAVTLGLNHLMWHFGNDATPIAGLRRLRIYAILA